MKNYVIINGTNSNTLTGLMINELPPITKPEMRTQIEEIDGRDGDIITKLGYSAYDKTITIGLFGTGYDVDNIIKFFNKEGTIVFSNEPDKYYNFTQVNNFDIERLLKFKTASITFHCQPFKYPLTETQKIIQPTILTSDGENITINNTASDSLKLSLKGNTSQASTPTPTSPIPVSVVSGDNDIYIDGGKNKLPFRNQDFTLNNVRYYVENGSLKLNGTSSGETSRTDNNFKENFSLYLEAGTYNFSKKSVSGNDYYFGAYINKYSDNTQLALINSTGTNTTFTLNATTQVYLGFYVYQKSFNNDNLEIMLSTTGGDYEPHTSQTYEVDFPVENMLDLENNILTTTQNGITFTYNNGTITYSGTATTTYANLTNFINLNIPTGTYTFSSKNTPISVAIRIADGNGTIGTYITSSGKTTFTTTSAGTKYYLYLSGLTANTSYSGELKLQLEKGSKANHYTEYGTTPIELCKIGTYQDYLYKDNGNWYKHSEIGKVVLNGSETTWSYGNGGWYTQDYATYIEKSTPAYSNRYTNTASTWQGNYTFSISTASFIAISDTTYPQAQRSNWITFLRNNNVIVYCVLSTPTTILIEDNNLIEQLDNLENAMSYEGQTNISQVNNDKPFIISASAVQSGTNEITINNIGNIYSKPLIALEGSGNVDIYLDDTQILKANVESKMNIDIAQLEAYNPDTSALLNRQVIGNYNSMTLQPGNNTIRIDGALDKATITNYTRWL